MTPAKVVRWWPPVGLLGMVLLGIAVGKGSTPIDDWFIHFGRAHRSVYALLVFTDARLVVLLFAMTVAVGSYRRRWRLAVVAAVTPVVAVVVVRLLKRLFDREKIGALAYPSGHVTVTIVVLGMAVLLVGIALWTVASVAVAALLGLLGQAFTYHYFTDTVGAVFLGTALVCVAFLAAKLDRCQPRCDVDHSAS